MSKILFFSTLSSIVAANSAHGKTENLANVERMLTEFQTELTTEGQQASKLYNEQACTCADTTDELNSNIDRDAALHTSANGNRDKAQTQMSILSADKGEEESIAWTANTIARNKADKNAEIEARKKFVEESLHRISQADEAITLVEGAKKSLATAGEKVDNLNFSFLQKNMKKLGYNPGPTSHSTDHDFIKKMLNDLYTDVTKQKQSDVKAMNVRKHKSALKCDKYDEEIKKFNDQLDRRKGRLSKEETNAAKSDEKMKLLVESMEGDRKVLGETTERCAATKAEYDADSKNRMAELGVITEALNVMKARNTEPTPESTSPDAYGASAELHEAKEQCSLNLDSFQPSAFLQKSSKYIDIFPTSSSTNSDNDNNNINESASFPDYSTAMQEIRTRNLSQKSTVLLSVMNAMARNDTMENVRQMIRDLLQKLKNEEANDATRYEECTRREKDLNAKKKTANEKLVKYEGELEQSQADVASAKSSIKKLSAEEVALKKSCNEQKSEKVMEKSLQKKELEVATNGRKVLEDTMSVLEQHFSDQAQAEMKSSYTGGMDRAAGITGMMQMLVDDFAHVIEKSSHSIDDLTMEIEDLEKLTSNAVKSKMKSRRAVESDELATAENEVARSSESLKQAVGAFSTQTQQLIFLKTKSAECATSTLSPEAITANKQAEADALKDVLEILLNHGSN